MSTTHPATDTVGAIVNRAADQALEYWGTPHDQEDQILRDLLAKGIIANRVAFAEVVEAKIAADWARNGNDLIGYGYAGHVDRQTRALFIEQQEIIAEQGVNAIAASQEPHTPAPSFWREAGVGLVAIAAGMALVVFVGLVGF